MNTFVAYREGGLPCHSNLHPFRQSRRNGSFGWKWEEMHLSDRMFLCQNPHCAYYHFEQDRDHNASHNILQETLRLIGLMDQAATGTGSDDGVNLAVDAG
jgi:putative transposase